jgi:hypothetical protein
MKSIMLKSFALRWLTILALALLTSLLFSAVFSNQRKALAIFSTTLVEDEPAPPDTNNTADLLLQPEIREPDMLQKRDGVIENIIPIPEPPATLATPSLSS